jgi:hypothetical protein
VIKATFWRTFNHDGKISTAWKGLGNRIHPLTPFTLSTPMKSKVRVLAQHGGPPGWQVWFCMCWTAVPPAFSVLYRLPRHELPQSTYFTVRGQSYFSRLPKYWPPHPPLRPASVSSPRNKGGGYTVAGRRVGWGVNILEDERNRIALLQ